MPVPHHVCGLFYCCVGTGDWAHTPHSPDDLPCHLVTGTQLSFCCSIYCYPCSSVPIKHQALKLL